MRAKAPSKSWRRGIEGQRQADLGDGTFLNPIVPGDHADPTILEDADDLVVRCLSRHRDLALLAA